MLKLNTITSLDCLEEETEIVKVFHNVEILKNSDFTVYDRFGENYIKVENCQKETIINANALKTAGIYFYIMKSKGKTKQGTIEIK
jgi:hypothetical protein